MPKKLYIFYHNVHVSELIPHSTLLTSLDQCLDFDEYHTSLGDMSVTDIISVSKMFDQLELIDIGFDKTSQIWLETKILLNYLGHRMPVLYHKIEPLKVFTDHSNLLANQNKKKIWIFGCSHSHGVGLLSQKQTFGALLGEHFQLPVNFITLPGSSLQWSLRHLINADILPDDLVIWQITLPFRLTMYDGVTKEIMLAQSSNRCLIDTFNDQQMFFHHCSLINYGVNYLRAKKIKFVLTSILNSQLLFYDYLNEYTKYPEYCYMPNSNVDLGTDNSHVGPLSHRVIALELTNYIQSIYH